MGLIPHTVPQPATGERRPPIADESSKFAVVLTHGISWVFFSTDSRGVSTPAPVQLGFGISASDVSLKSGTLEPGGVTICNSTALTSTRLGLRVRPQVAALVGGSGRQGSAPPGPVQIERIFMMFDTDGSVRVDTFRGTCRDTCPAS